MSRFEVVAISSDHQIKFDTALYRTMLTPTLFNDVNRESHANTILADWVIKEANQKQLANISEILSYMLRNANT